ncbi:MAG: lipoyl(octanoyl) transferase LipB [Bacteroidales bacterium]|nr:lipoyl(octanoyl) transferase LipB [Bacteroidales bacterium]MBN2819173.1 lipoyl(octanoyl) transferase LipB [Bacteroidales bacterium]
MNRAQYIDFGLKEYREAWQEQERYHNELVEAKKNKTETVHKLIFNEHPHVFTLGKSGQQNNLLINDEFLKKINASYYQSNRGGDITYHGPGQIVGYPIFDLEILKLGVKEYIHMLETAIVRTLAGYNIAASPLEGATGVWLDINTPNARKICAIGVRVSKAITMHGFALNVNTDLKYFSYINPCGFIDKGVTSMEKELGVKPEFEEVKQKLKNHLIDLFKLNLI